jgi:hypothetical protein
MAIVANTFTSFDAKGIRESLSSIISSISPHNQLNFARRGAFSK